MKSILLPLVFASFTAHAATTTPMIPCVAGQDKSPKIELAPTKEGATKAKTMSISEMIKTQVMPNLRVGSFSINKDTRLKLLGSKVTSFSGDISLAINFSKTISAPVPENTIVTGPVLADKNSQIVVHLIDAADGSDLMTSASQQSQDLVQNLRNLGLKVDSGRYPRFAVAVEFNELASGKQKFMRVSAESVTGNPLAELELRRIVGVIDSLEINGVPVFMYSFEGRMGLGAGINTSAQDLEFKDVNAQVLGIKIMASEDSDPQTVANLKSLDGKVCSVPTAEIDIIAKTPTVTQKLK